MAIFEQIENSLRIEAARTALFPEWRMGELVSEEEVSSLLLLASPGGDYDEKRAEWQDAFANQLQELKFALANDLEITLLTRLQSDFQLSSVELLCLSATLWAESDWRCRRLFSLTQGAMERFLPTLEIMGRMIDMSAHDLKNVLEKSVLLELGILRLIDEQGPCSNASLTMVQASKVLFEFLAPHCGELPGQPMTLAGDADQALAFWIQNAGVWILFGPIQASPRERAINLAGDCRRPLLIMPPVRTDNPGQFKDFFLRAHLQQAIIYVEHWQNMTSVVPQALLLSHAASFRIPLIIRSEDRDAVPRSYAGRPVVREELSLPSSAQRKEIWDRCLSDLDIRLPDDDRSQLAKNFSLYQLEIPAVISRARTMAAEQQQPTTSFQTLCQAAMEFCTCRFNGSAKQLRPERVWDDLILRKSTFENLEEICQWMENRYQVMDQWGFNQKLSTGRGVAALFHGPPGTGKTLAAEVIARALGSQLIVVDLALIVNKYVGETEKNLKQLFEGMAQSPAVLFFDEADALFGKRTEVKDAHDRFANQEVSYLLQQIERYPGLVILTSNFKTNIDSAFLRRFQFNIEFVKPGSKERLRLWHHFLHPDMPSDIKEEDIVYLADKFKVSGAAIRNIVLRAAFRAAHQHHKVGITHLFHALQVEYRQADEACDLSLFRPYEELLKAGHPAGAEEACG